MYADPNANREYHRNYRLLHRQHIVDLAREWRKRNPVRNSAWFKIRHWRRCGRLLLVKQELGGQCARCGEGNPLVLDFDHVVPATKVRGLSGIDSLAEMRDEAKKCQLLCANCHRLKTWYGREVRTRRQQLRKG